MTSIVKIPVIEDRYIAHLAGMQGETKFVDFSNKFNSYYAQKHPILNTIGSSITGSIKGVATTTFGLLAYPLVNTSMRESIFGSATQVCVSCGFSAKSLTDLFLNVQGFLKPAKAQTYWGQKISSFGMGFGAAGACALDEKVFLQCRGINYAGSIWDTLSNNYVFIGAATVSLAALFTYSKMNEYAQQEIQTEEALKRSLTDQFSKIASRLKALESNPEIQECAKNILLRRLEINKEVENLNLPSLTQKNIEQITQPVFAAANELKLKKV